LAALLGCSGDVVNLGEDASPRPTPPSYSRCVDSPTLTADVYVGQQSELDALEGCETIDGDLYVQPFFHPALRPLHELKVVTGTLAFGQLSRPEEQSPEEVELAASVFGRWLPSLEGLEALESVGSLKIGEVSAFDLAPLSGLRALTGEGILVVTGGNLRDLAPLGRLRGIRSLHVYGERLESIAELELPPTLSVLDLNGEHLSELGSLRQLRSVEGWLNLSGIAVRDLTSFSALESVGEFFVNSRVLENLNGLEQLTDVGGDVSILGNPLLDNIDALTTLRHAEHLAISNNASLRQIPDFPALGPLKGLHIMDNPALEHVAEFSGIWAEASLPLRNGTRTRSYADALNTIYRRPDAIRIINNPALRAFSMPVGWEGGKYVEINNNASLETLALTELENIGVLQITSNPQLRSVGLGLLDTVDSLTVLDNRQLLPSTFDPVQTFERNMSGNAGMPPSP
jgi:Leucine-rich repeat (LRR) protein